MLVHLGGGDESKHAGLTQKGHSYNARSILFVINLISNCLLVGKARPMLGRFRPNACGPFMEKWASLVEESLS